MEEITDLAISNIDEKILPICEDNLIKVHYYKMKGDY